MTGNVQLMHAIEKLRLAFVGDLTLGELASRLSAAHGSTTLVEEPNGERWSGDRLVSTVDEWAMRVRALVAPGDRVVVRLPNGFGFFVACLAVSRAGAIVVPVNDKMRKSEIDHVVRDSGAALVVNDRAVFHGGPTAAPVADSASPDDVAAVLYTSGTTGLPKGAQLTHRGLLSGIRRGAAVPSSIRDDEAVFALPVAHIMGFAGLLGLLIAGVRSYVFPRFHPVEVLDAIEQRRSSIFVGVPTMYRMLLEAGAAQRDLKSVRVWMSGADAMPPDLVRSFQRFGASATLPLVGTSVGEALFVEGYGMVELSGGVAFKLTPPFAGGLLLRPVGVPLPSNDLRVVDDTGASVAMGRVGALEVRGPGVLKGYLGNEEASAEAVTADGWLRTGDLARRLPFGAVEFAGRAKDVIKVGGYSVFAAEVQAVLEEVDGVAEAVVVGLDDTRLGQVPAAALRAVPGQDLDTADVAAHAVEHLAAYKVPARWVVVAELPRTGTGKVQRDLVRLLFSDG